MGLSRSFWIQVYIPVPILILLDNWTKSLALHYSRGQEGPFGPFYLIFNHGAMLGLFSDLPPTLRIVSLSTFGALIVGVYFLFQYLIPGRHMKLRIGLSILLGGILGNVWDRIRYGAIIDFIKFKAGNLISPIFNVADIIQWVGYGIILYYFIREGHTLWPEQNSRKSFWVNAPFQKRFSVFLATISLILTGIFVVFCYTYLKVTLQELTASNQQIVHKFVRPFVLLILGLGFGFSFLIYILGSLFSHRIAGPIYAFERFLRDTINGKKPGFRMRQSDEFKHLEPLAIEISEKFSSLEAAQLQRDSADKIVSSADPEGK
ncbi:MAG: signal peptidase II [Bdellovibrionales bacterium]